MPSRWIVGALFAGLALTVFGRASPAAPNTTVVLEYNVAPGLAGCLDAREFKAKVARQLGHDPFRSEAERRVVVQIARKDSAFEGEVMWTDATGGWVGDRSLSSHRSGCRDIGGGLAFLVAVQIQLLETLAPPPPPPDPEPPPPPSVITEPPPPPPPPAPIVSAVVTPPPPPPSRPRKLTLSVGLGPAVAYRLTPAPAAVGRLIVGVRIARFSVELGLDGSLPSPQRHVDGSGFSLFRFASSAAACGHAHIFAACLTAAAGVLQARGVGVDAPGSPRGWFSQVGARAALRHEFGSRFFATARLDVLTMVGPWTVEVNDAPYWTTPRVGGILAMDVGARIF